MTTFGNVSVGFDITLIGRVLETNVALQIGGGGAIACAGQDSTLLFFGKLDEGCTNGGFFVNGSATRSRTSQAIVSFVPEPATLGLVAAGLGGLAVLRTRTRRRRGERG